MFNNFYLIYYIFWLCNKVLFMDIYISTHALEKQHIYYF